MKEQEGAGGEKEQGLSAGLCCPQTAAEGAGG